MTCPKCQVSGGLSPDSDSLDCTYCEAAERRTALARWVVLNCRHMTPEQRDWAVYQHAVEQINQNSGEQE